MKIRLVLVMGAIILACLNAGLETDIYILSFPDIMDDIGFSQNEVQLLFLQRL